jgi:hypothetical protein
MRQFRDYVAYSVMESGEIINKNTGKALRPQVNNCGYARVNMCKDGKKPRFFIHRIVAECYIPNPHNLPQVNHKDGNKSNNAASNLEWCTSSENHRHSFANLGRKPTRVCGERSGAFKISLLKIEEARQRKSSGELIKNIAKDYGIHRKYLGALLSGKACRHG